MDVVARVAKVAAERLDDVEDALSVPSGLQVGEVRELCVELGAITRCESAKTRQGGKKLAVSLDEEFRA